MQQFVQHSLGSALRISWTFWGKDPESLGNEWTSSLRNLRVPTAAR